MAMQPNIKLMAISFDGTVVQSRCAVQSTQRQNWFRWCEGARKKVSECVYPSRSSSDHVKASEVWKGGETITTGPLIFICVPHTFRSAHFSSASRVVNYPHFDGQNCSGIYLR